MCVVRLALRRMVGSSLALLLISGAAPALAADRITGFAQQLRKAAEAEDCRAVIKAVRKGLPDDQHMPAELALAGLALGTQCALQAGDLDQADQWVMRATAYPDAEDRLWRTRLMIQFWLTQTQAAVRTIEAMHDGRIAALNGVPQRVLYQFLRQLKEAGFAEERQKVLEILSSSGYVPDEPVADGDDFRHQYVQLLVEKGGLEEARAIGATIENPDVLIAMVSDPRLRDLVPAGFDELVATEKALANAQNAMVLFEDHLRPHLAASAYLRKLGRFRDALESMMTARNREGGLEGFADADQYLVWWWDSLSRVHMKLGDGDAAIADLREGTKLKEDGGFNVSLTINLAQTLLKLGRPQEALGVLDPAVVEKMNTSPYGAMQVRFARACALAQLGRASEADADFDYARQHAGDAPSAMIGLLLCRGDMDGAAKALIARLDDPQQRARALGDLVEYNEEPPPASRNPADIAFPALLARADVAAAIARAGGRKRIRLYEAAW